MSFTKIIEKMSIKSYVKKLNNTMLKDLYFKSIKKNPKTHLDHIMIGVCIDEMKKRGIINEKK